MRKHIVNMLLILLAAGGLRATNITGGVADLTGFPVTSRTFARFELKNCENTIPRVRGQAIIAPAVTDVVPNASGILFGQVIGNDAITCGGVRGTTYYHVAVWSGRTKQFDENFYIAGLSWDITLATPLGINPVVTGIVSLGTASADPGTCTPGNVYQNTTTTRLRICVSTNVWADSVTKTQVGLGSVDNTADTAKPVSTATQTALDLKAPKDNPVFTGIVSVGTTVPAGAPAGTLGASVIYSPNRPLNVKAFGAVGDNSHDDTPMIQAAITAAGDGGATYLPAGNYKITTALHPRQGSVILCDSTDVKAQVGTIISASGAIWALEDTVHDGSRRNVQVWNCGFSLSTGNLGAMNLRSMSWGKYYNISIHFPNGGAMTGVQFDGQDSVGAYWNEFYSPNFYSDTSTNTHIGFSSINGAAEEKIFGGNIENLDTAFDMVGASKIEVYGLGAEYFTRGCIYFSGVNASDNLFMGTRCESATSGAVGITFGVGSARNHILWPSIAVNDIEHEIVDNSPGNNVVEIDSQLSRKVDFGSLPLTAGDTVSGAATGLVTNGSFTTDTAWTKGSGWTIAGGVAHFDGVGHTSASLTQAIGIDVGYYKVSITVKNWVNGAPSVILGGTYTVSPAISAANGTYITYVHNTGVNGTLYVYGPGSEIVGYEFTGDVDDVSVVALTGSFSTPGLAGAVASPTCSNATGTLTRCSGGAGAVSVVCWKADGTQGYGTAAEIAGGTCH